MYVFWLISVLFLWIQGIRLGQSETSCGPPPVIEKTIISPIGIKDFPIGTIIKYSCDFGYLTHQTLPTTKCVAGEDPDTAVWTKIRLDCIPRSCGDPGVANHAQIEGSVFSYPNSVTYVCDEGYKLLGSSKRFCQTNGEWSGNEPSCIIIICNVPESPGNGRAKYDSREYGAKLNYECNKGFRPNETKERICDADGKWSGSTPSCVDMQCNFPESPEHGSIDLPGGIPKVDSIVFYKCNDGRKLIGSLRAKCLASGDWTFPTPICVEPCVVPAIQNGAIIKYRYRSPEKIPEGTEIDDVKKLFLKCDRNFEPNGQREREVSISCVDGTWSIEPKCYEASCWFNPPNVPHATLKTREIHNGVTLTYNCITNYYKFQFGKVTCIQGTWQGNTPVCKDSRCYITSVTVPGIAQSLRGLYRNTTVVKAQCNAGYTLTARGNGEMRCENGEWRGAVPPCIGAPCSDPPPSPKNGRIESYSGLHGTSVKYICNDNFALKNPSDSITCELGQWTGQIPECKDSRCYLDDLSNKEGIDLSHSGPALSGDLAEVHCLRGYILKYSKPRCSKGVWSTQNKHSPCQKGNCDVTVLQNGEFVYAETTRYWAFLKAKYVYETTYKPARVPSSQRPESKLFVRCRSPYIFNGINPTAFVSVTCDKGQWNPLPHCLKRGQRPPSVPDRQPNSAKVEPTAVPQVASSSTMAPSYAPRTSQKATDIPGLSTAIGLVDVENQKNCSCTLNAVDENLIAYSGNEQLVYGSKVKPNHSVQFQCRIFGFHRLRGAPELTCRNCSWDSWEFPNCISPSVGDPIIIVDSKDSNSFTFTQSGSLVIPLNVDVNITCHLHNINDWTYLKGLKTDLKLEHTYFQFDGQPVFSSYLQIKNIKASDTGTYTCTKKNGGSAFQVEIIIGDAKCPNIVEGNDLVVGYGVQEFHRVATFYCRNANKALIGPDKITCLSSGQWSADAPKCKEVIQCPELEETQGLTVTYTNHRQMNSSAAFHCADPYRRKGVAYVTCLANGEWSESSVHCTLPTCTVDSVFDVIPITVTVDLINMTGVAVVTHGTSLNIICLGDNEHIIGDRSVTCTELGQWFAGDVKCVFGCDSVVKSINSTLIIQPEKEVYKFGDDAVFTCPPGQELTTDVERAICLQDGWSDVFPDCRDIKV